MSRPSANTTVRWIGLAAGLAAAALLLLGWRVPPGTGTLGADVKLVATAPGELSISSTGAFVQARGLVSNGPAATGRMNLRNLTGRAVAVQMRLLPSKPDLDGALRIELVAAPAVRALAARRSMSAATASLSDGAGQPVAVGWLGALRRWSRRSIRIEPGGTRRLDARALVPPGARDYEGRIVDVTLELRARPVKG